MSMAKLLVVDDEPFNLDIVAEYLDEMDFELVMVESGEAAWEAVHGAKVHVTVGKMAKRLSRLARFFPGLIAKQSKKIDGLGTAGH